MLRRRHIEIRTQNQIDNSIEFDRQIDSDRQMDNWVARQIDRWIVRRQIDRQTDNWMDRQIVWLEDRQIERQTDRQADRLRNRQSPAVCPFFSGWLCHPCLAARLPLYRFTILETSATALWRYYAYNTCLHISYAYLILNIYTCISTYFIHVHEQAQVHVHTYVRLIHACPIMCTGSWNLQNFFHSCLGREKRARSCAFQDELVHLFDHGTSRYNGNETEAFHGPRYPSPNCIKVTG